MRPIRWITVCSVAWGIGIGLPVTLIYWITTKTGFMDALGLGIVFAMTACVVQFLMMAELHELASDIDYARSRDYVGGYIRRRKIPQNMNGKQVGEWQYRQRQQ